MRIRRTRCLVAVLIALLPVGSRGVQAQKPPLLVLPITKTTAHLVFTAGLSRDVIVPGRRMSILVDINPKPGMHVYAPHTERSLVVPHSKTIALLLNGLAATIAYRAAQKAGRQRLLDRS